MHSTGSASQHNFATVPSVSIPRSTFDRSHTVKTAFDSGYLVPFMVDEVLPGDTMQIDTTVLARLTTPIVPFMDNVYLDTFFFFVPNRLVWEHWQNFCGEQSSPGASTDYTVPVMYDTQFVGAPGEGILSAENSLADYFGIPPNTTNSLKNINALPFRAYNLVWNEWFRDENLQDPVIVDTGDNESDLTDYVLLRRGKRHDYFTSCLPWPQKGPAVDLPLGVAAPVYGTGNAAAFLSPTDGRTQFLYRHDGNSASDGFITNVVTPSAAVAANTLESTLGGSAGSTNGALLGLAPKNAFTEVSPAAYADLTQATAATINTVREAFQLQKLFERDARGGTRYIELLRSHFGVVSPDARLQRPEYLGGKSIPISVNQVAQTSSTDSASPQGNLAAYAVGVSTGSGFSHSFVEHGYVLGLVCVRADLNYQQGIERMWSRRTRYDFFWPSLQFIGEQPVYNREIYADGSVNDDKVFGYQERYAEYRFAKNQICGRLRSQSASTLDYWHLAQKFDSCPTLSAEFIEEHPPIDRVLAVQDEPQFVADIMVRNKCTRPMALFSVPGLVDHF